MNMDQDAVAGYERLLADFSNLEKSLPRSRKTIMEVSGYPHYENVASNILAFFLDSEEEHGFGDLWARSLIECALGAGAEPPGETCSVDREVLTPSRKRLDILLTTRNYTVGIENKVFAGLYNDLADYGELIDRTAREEGTQHVAKIVLSVFEEAAQSGFANVTYAELFAAVRSHLGSHLEEADNTWIAYMKDFIYTIEKLESGDTMASASDRFVREHFREADELYMHLYQWKKEAKRRARAILDSAELPSGVDYCQDPFVYQDADGFYTCISIDIRPAETHRLVASAEGARLTVEIYRNEDGWGAWLWSRNNKEAGKEVIAGLLDEAGIGHDGDNVVAKLPWDAADNEVVQLVYDGIDAARKIL